MTMKQPQMCLTAESLSQLAHDELSPSELHDFEQHVTDCPRCRELLEAADSDPQWREEICPVLKSPDESPLVNNNHDESGHQAESLASVLHLLGPTDDPQMLGRIGPYEVVGVIGRGGMGVVFKAFDAPLNRFVAIKMLLPHLAASGAARKRFAREGQAAAAVIDDHVMPIYSVAEWQGVPYLVTQYSGGATLQKRIQQQGPLEVAEILRIAMQTARGLAAAHAQGLVHRDVKPSNILLDGTVERAMLTDFGLARAVDDASITRSGVIAGTPQYMSPEQARGGSVDARSDLFGLGCVLYAICTGRPPFRAENSHAILRLITDEEPRPIREMNPEIPEWLCSIVTKLMSKQPDDRFTSAEEVAELLEVCLAHVQQPTTVPLPESCRSLRRSRVSFAFPMATLFRRWPLFSILVTAGFAGLLILAGIVIVLELGKGTLTITSEANDVPIRIMQGDDVVENLTVSQAGKTVRIAAGRYQVEIDGNIDGIAIADKTVTLTRRGQATVKVVRSEDKESEAALAEGIRTSRALQDADRRRAILLQHYGEKHPEVLKLDAKIKAMENRLLGNEVPEAPSPADEIYTEAYPVGDFARPVKKPANDDASDTAKQPTGDSIELDYDSLIRLITRTIAQKSWDKVGGPGSIEAFPTTHSLVILQSRRVHEQIKDLFVQLRKRVRENAAAPDVSTIKLYLAYLEPADDLVEHTVVGSDRKVFVQKEPIATDADIETAQVIDDSNGQPAIQVTFKATSARRLGEVTERHRDQPLTVFVDGKLLSAPTIRERFTSKAVITGQFSREEANRIANAINANSGNKEVPGSVGPAASKATAGDLLALYLGASDDGGALRTRVLEVLRNAQVITIEYERERTAESVANDFAETLRASGITPISERRDGKAYFAIQAVFSRFWGEAKDMTSAQWLEQMKWPIAAGYQLKSVDVVVTPSRAVMSESLAKSRAAMRSVARKLEAIKPDYGQLEMFSTELVDNWEDGDWPRYEHLSYKHHVGSYNKSGPEKLSGDWCLLYVSILPISGNPRQQPGSIRRYPFQALEAEWSIESGSEALNNKFHEIVKTALHELDAYEDSLNDEHTSASRQSRGAPFPTGISSPVLSTGTLIQPTESRSSTLVLLETNPDTREGAASSDRVAKAVEPTANRRTQFGKGALLFIDGSRVNVHVVGKESVIAETAGRYLRWKVGETFAHAIEIETPHVKQ